MWWLGAQDARAARHQARQLDCLLPQRAEGMGAALGAAGAARSAKAHARGVLAKARAGGVQPVFQARPRQQALVDAGGAQVERVGQRRAHAMQFERIGAEIAHEFELERPGGGTRWTSRPGQGELGRQQIGDEALQRRRVFPPERAAIAHLRAGR
jgi:hypothetical protein